VEIPVLKGAKVAKIPTRRSLCRTPERSQYLPVLFFTSKQTASGHSATNQAPVFTLSHGNIQSFSNQNQSTMTGNAQQSSFEGFDLSNSGNVGNFIVPEYPSIDFDWGSMINMNTDED
jgi:hypothetical protein